jgi:hypothetical protein
MRKEICFSVEKDYGGENEWKRKDK